jgi:hypothetical protein
MESGVYLEIAVGMAAHLAVVAFFLGGMRADLRAVIYRTEKCESEIGTVRADVSTLKTKVAVLDQKEGLA